MATGLLAKTMVAGKGQYFFRKEALETRKSFDIELWWKSSMHFHGSFCNLAIDDCKESVKMVFFLFVLRLAVHTYRLQVLQEVNYIEENISIQIDMPFTGRTIL